MFGLSRLQLIVSGVALAGLLVATGAAKLCWNGWQDAKALAEVREAEKNAALASLDISRKARDAADLAGLERERALAEINRTLTRTRQKLKEVPPDACFDAPVPADAWRLLNDLPGSDTTAGAADAPG